VTVNYLVLIVIQSNPIQTNAADRQSKSLKLTHMCTTERYQLTICGVTAYDTPM